ncbi:MAG TPA: class I SAM-dependent methyltransferase [Alphaproteobacteria bacterium]|jgi:SAM-dependent methyltransferase|nr:class I SAM-dependent methyltransferase [Alphaproteobacteria bacterium]MDP6272050.1 class I SAM-dependent methyltransferase [Alphaproteobacteria bacterium]MDP7164945.1 class I SAM-dependent methyltransferase [Alphaproteobacteria bacterium]MDP7429285.1 class I SAM-dependent methyltransferase [Alphaproteobacteria bacterium]HJM50030.1 class I SAM-dependent methyltransferase [Alphaproteobacteria bacterium]
MTEDDDETAASSFFEPMYAASSTEGEGLPWAHMQANGQLAEWLRDQPPGSGRPALVTGCGLGDDAEEIARRGWEVMAFDVAESAIRLCLERFPQSSVDYRIADLFRPPDDWRGAFALVFDNRTVQSLPYELQPRAMAAVAGLVAPGGTLVVVTEIVGPEHLSQGPPYRMLAESLVAYEAAGLARQSWDEVPHREDPPSRHARVVYGRSR